MHRAPPLADILAIGDESERLEALLDVAEQRVPHDPDEACTVAEAAADLASRINRPGDTGASLCLQAWCHFRSGAYSQARERGLRALRLLQLWPQQESVVWEQLARQLEPRQKRLLAHGMTALAVSAFRLADYANALLYASKEVLIKRLLGDRRGEALARHGLGWGYNKVGLYQKALEHHFEALTILEEVSPEELSGPYNGVAATYVNLGHYQQALFYARRAMEAADGHDAQLREQATALRTIGTIHHRLRDFEAAQRHFQQSLALADPGGRVLAQLSLGRMQLEQGRYAGALAHFEACLQVDTDDLRRRVRAEVLIGIGRVYLAQGRPVTSLPYLQEALEHADAEGAPVERADAHLGLWEAHKALGDPAKALEHFEAHHFERLKVVQEISDIRTKVLMIQFDVERLQKDREIHRLKHVELARANADLTRLNAALEEQAAVLERLSNLDGLTGLYNRRHFDAKLHYELERARRYAHPLSLMLLDIDDFKAVNDAHSHVVGDEVLRTLATLLKEHTRDLDVAARYGGEELAVIFPETSLEHAREAAEKLRRLVEGHDWEALSPGLAVSVSAGLACVPPGSAEELVARADEELYRAKRSGKNRVCF